MPPPYGERPDDYSPEVARLSCLTRAEMEDEWHRLVARILAAPMMLSRSDAATLRALGIDPG